MILPLLACFALAQPELPEILIDRDNVAIDRSCRVIVPLGVVIEDADNNGVIHVVADGVTIQWLTYWPEDPERDGAHDGALVARQSLDHYETMTGVGIRIDGHRDVTLRNARVHGYKVAIWATAADNLTLIGCDVSDGYAMRLGSTPAAEDSADWLWPHNNDAGEWATNYGAGILIERSTGVTVRDSLARRRQNALILDRVTDSTVYDNDFSFLSGWGIAMWRSSRNVISRNALDFCIRGYSHGVYNRGQDSAGILLFEQCNSNLFIANSATHGGDGLFGFGGKEALGEAPAPELDADGTPWSYERQGCNENVFVGNDFSYAAAHGLELTFSFGNIIVDNRFVENAICGIWGGYSQDTYIQDNEFSRNGQAGYGLERGGINIEHSERNVITANRFEGNTAGVHLWHDADPGLMSGKWAAANHQRTRDNTIVGNTFESDAVGIHLRAVVSTVAANNTFTGVAQPILADVPSADGSSSEPIEPRRSHDPVQDPLPPGTMAVVMGESRPVGARAHLAGRHNIIMGEYFPWDHESPMVRRGPDDNGSHVYEVLGVSDPALVTASVDQGTVQVLAPADGDGDAATLKGVRVVVGGDPDSDVTAYTLTLGGAVEAAMGDVIVDTKWFINLFRSDVDPRQYLEIWRRAQDGSATMRGSVDGHLHLPFAHAGPSRLDGLISWDMHEPLNVLPHATNAPEADHFGTIARTTLRLPAGRWRITTLSDDGVRVIINGQTILENWTHHGPTRDAAEFDIPLPREGEQPPPTEIVVEHFELDGYAVLEVNIEPVK